MSIASVNECATQCARARRSLFRLVVKILTRTGALPRRGEVARVGTSAVSILSRSSDLVESHRESILFLTLIIGVKT